MDDPSREAASSDLPKVYCGSCASRIFGVRYKCQACYDFDYCSECYKEAALTHPGHEFRGIRTEQLGSLAQDHSAPLPAASAVPSASPDETRDTASLLTGHCRSCALLGLVLPTLDIAVREIQNEKRQKLNDWIRKEVPGDDIVEDPKLNKRLAANFYAILKEDVSITLAELESLPWTRLYARCQKIYEDFYPSQLEETAKRNNKESLPQLAARVADIMQRSLGEYFPISGFELEDGKSQDSTGNPNRGSKEQLLRAITSEAVSFQWPYDRFYFYITPIRSKKDLKLPDFNKLRFDLGKATDDPELLRELFRYSRVLLPLHTGLISFEVDAYATHDDPVGRIISSRTPNPSSSSEESFRVVKGWISDCNQKHPNCLQDPKSRSVLPRRLIEIGENGFLKLREASLGEQGQYVALSYCWGGSQKFQTTKATIAERRNGFSIADLPKTIRDAIQVTQSIGLRYIWVDSLCIVQDDLPDKAQDIARMANVYKESYLTISASRASDAEEGFLSDNADKSTGLWKGLIPVDYWVRSPTASTTQKALSHPGEKGTLWLLDESDGVRELCQTSTSLRGWCLQEHILSPRLLSYGRWPTWRCRETTDADGGFYTSETRMRDITGTLEHRLLDILFHFRRTRCSPQGVDMFTMTQLYQCWYAVVHDFSKRMISVSSDRFPAIGAIASEISELTGSGYMAGLWEQNMLHDLMWSTKATEWACRPPEWRAPSWSWASVDSTITYCNITADSTPLATVRDCKCNVKYPAAPFGEPSREKDLWVRV
ncbi:heterokaryon incompatibility protein-domain-containing protein [Aspergillus tetrazonus]